MQTLDLNLAKLRLSRVSLPKNLHTAAPLAKKFSKEFAQARESATVKLVRAMSQTHLRGSKAGKSSLTRDHAKNRRSPGREAARRNAQCWRLIHLNASEVGPWAG
jgi:ribosomal 50S subunit-associated protein YjgA (DUF615 family)